MPTELDEYLDSLGLDGDDRTALSTILTKKPEYQTAAVTAHRERLTRADYTKKTQELATERTRLQATQTDLNSQLVNLNKQLETGQVTAAKYRAKLEAINREWGEAVIDMKDLDTLPIVETTKTTPAAFDPTPFETRLRQAETNYAVAPEISGIMMDLRSEYEDVFGTAKGFSAEKLLKYSRENKVPLRGERDPDTGVLIGAAGAFEKLFKVPEKRHEILVKTITEKAEKDANDKMQQRLDQQLAGNATGDRNPNSWNTGSHLLSGGFKQNQADRITATAKENGREITPPSEGRSAAQAELGGGGAAFARAYLERRAKGISFGQDGKAA
jgi:hypothetical protein